MFLPDSTDEQAGLGNTCFSYEIKQVFQCWGSLDVKINLFDPNIAC